MKKFNKTKRRSDTKKRRAASLIGVSEPQINHAENGRKDLTPDFTLKLVTGYGYSYQDFLDYVTSKKEAPESLLAECISILKRLHPEKIKTVKAILDSF